MKKKAVVAGASGLVGGFCLEELLKNPQYGKVTALVRKTLGLKHPKLQELVVDFDRMEKVSGRLKADDVFCCLGTVRKKSPTPEAYRKVDFDYVLKLARITSRNKARKFLVVSSMGANPHSFIFYSRLKGEMEEAVSRVKFKEIHVFRPSFILGEEGRKERQPSERIFELILKPFTLLFSGPFRKYRPIPAKTIARAMVQSALQERAGIHLWESDQIEKQAG
jgi:uncharacterized protein YbjT (DUF2867 family)